MCDVSVVGCALVLWLLVVTLNGRRFYFRSVW